MQGNNFQIDKEPLLDLPICAPAEAEQRRIGLLVERIIECQRQIATTRSLSEQEQLARVMGHWDDEIQYGIEALYGVSEDDKVVLAGETASAPSEEPARLL